ncbi:MAG: UvrD-helicase domain-containing protein [Betaproteobacteria bacterium]|nr:UvrD-helicase domain-containing protein [Betaproteobacteria bacterium]
MSSIAPSLLAGLNPEQLSAVTLPPQHALILAGAGSGKTRVLTTRIAWLISTSQAGPHGILAVTFTNKAAKEMLTRLSAMLPLSYNNSVRGMWIGTFHGLCNRLLRAHYREAGLPQLFQILDQADQLSTIKRLLKSLNVDDEKFPPRELQHFINAQKEQGLRAAAVEAWDSFARRRVELYDAYERQCQREGVVDFAELLLRSHELLERHESLRRHYQERFRHILVDEFQDTNRLQYAWLRMLAGNRARNDHPPSPLPEEGGDNIRTPKDGAYIFAVGDDDQSIYGFRGAEVGNMRDLEREFQVAKVIRLEQNYRSHGNILDAANAIIKNNAARLGKNLWTEAGSGEPIRVFESLSDLDEARWIVEEIKSLSRDGHARKEVALLYRSNAQSRVLEHALFNAGLPYRVYGGLRFFERQEIKHALAYLRLIANPDDDTAFSRVVNFPTRGIGNRSLEQLADAAKTHGSSLHAAIQHLGGKAQSSLSAFAQLIVRMREGSAGLPLPEVVDHVLELSGLLEHYRNEKEGQDRLANLDELINAAASFVAEEGSREPAPDGAEDQSDLASFLAHAALEAGEHQAGDSDDAVQLMTVHSAKGLEFNVVFISGLEAGLFPHENAVLEEKGLEEERRLMYVAVTRARQRLYLSFAQTRMLHGQTRYNLPSRFLDEIPVALLKWLTPKLSSGFVAPPKTSYAPAYAAEPQRQANAMTMRQQSDSGLRIGQNVMHTKFGHGVIINAEGAGTDARVQVNFKHAGMKWLALSIAKLEAA